ncbi:MAG: hypothetical protein K6F69_04710 [Treponema sp.]|nr:hypothetical protein [Treponema sp.]
METKMEIVCICPGCNRTINKEFLYCPWCGTCRMNMEDKSAMDAVFEKMENLVSENRSKKINRLRNHLDSLKEELDTICLNRQNSGEKK